MQMLNDEYPAPDRIVATAASAIFDKALVTNVFRSMLVEAIVNEALRPDWYWCGADYAS
jgi:hypothetical protein